MRLKSEMQDLLSFFKSHGNIKIRPLEEELGLPNATIKLRRGYICPKHIPVIQAYLKKEYGYEYFLKEDMGNTFSHINKSVVKKSNKESGVLISVYVLGDSVKIEINKI